MSNDHVDNVFQLLYNILVLKLSICHVGKETQKYIQQSTQRGSVGEEMNMEALFFALGARAGADLVACSKHFLFAWGEGGSMSTSQQSCREKTYLTINLLVWGCERAKSVFGRTTGRVC